MFDSKSLDDYVLFKYQNNVSIGWNRNQSICVSCEFKWLLNYFDKKNQYDLAEQFSYRFVAFKTHGFV